MCSNRSHHKSLTILLDKQVVASLHPNSIIELSDIKKIWVENSTSYATKITRSRYCTSLKCFLLPYISIIIDQIVTKVRRWLECGHYICFLKRFPPPPCLHKRNLHTFLGFAFVPAATAYQAVAYLTQSRLDVFQS